MNSKLVLLALFSLAVWQAFVEAREESLNLRKRLNHMRKEQILKANAKQEEIQVAPGEFFCG